MFGANRLQLKSPDELEVMRRAGLVVARTLAAVEDAVRPGITTGELNDLAEDAILSSGAIPSFLGYSEPPYPASICTSVNDEVVHGIPGDRVLAEGDIVSVDCGAIVDGWHGDAAVTIAVGETSPEASELMRVTREALWAGLAAVRFGGRVGDIGAAVEAHVRSQGAYGVVEDYTGHGIGTEMHMPPEVPNLGGTRGPRMRHGTTLAVEPMVTTGDQATTVRPDEWTVATRDGGWAAHHEHTFALTERGVWVLTALDGGAAELERLGVPYGGPD
ncbi:type I methionyl aminopeptidase [Nocardioides panacisoli]|uniref:type I methionyl aminopeptidase n=1 Tax=Nocardioides panacisoli TaxID=627624 RepID=UPI001C637CF1|nr:type I methionyl aminopeptidase [Nocardioides panacisoli]QYJ04084.1 type I methionyl aminopeptidase [Nocardioides panacisoli]